MQKICHRCGTFMQCVIGDYWQCSCEVKKAPAAAELTKGPPEIKLGECSEVIIWHDIDARPDIADIKPGQIRDFWTYQARASFRPFKLSGTMQIFHCGSCSLMEACEIVNIGIAPLTYKAL